MNASSKAWAVVVSIGLLALGACSSDDGAEEFSFELTEIADFDVEVYTFEASGDSVEEGLMCAAGDWVWHGNETTDGEVMTDQMLHELSEGSDPWEMVVVSEYVCADGSGSITVANRHTVDLDADRSGEVIGSWTVRAGEVDGTAIDGSGDVIAVAPGSGEDASLTGFLTGT